MVRTGLLPAERRGLIEFAEVPGRMPDGGGLRALTAELARCRLCRDAPRHGPPLPHEPRPIVQLSARSLICIASQAPGTRAHNSGVPFQDPSGVRLRAWLGVDEARFYDPDLFAIVPMGCCFPGLDRHGGDLPPRRECAPVWRERIFAELPALDLILVIGGHSQRWHLGREAKAGLTETVRAWRTLLESGRSPRVLPLPHPSWRNTGWLRRNPWFEAECLPVLRAEVARLAADRQPVSRATRLDVSQREPPMRCTSP